MKLSDLEQDAQLDVPVDAGAQIQEFARLYPLGFKFIVDALCGKDRIIYRPMPGLDTGMLMAWLDGRRFVGVQLTRIVETPIELPPDTEGPARTITEQVRRREERGE